MQLDALTLSHLAERSGVAPRWLVWISARNRTTDATETIGLWNGPNNQSFFVEGEWRLYVGAGGLVGLQPLTYEAGSVVRIQTLAFSPISAEVEQVIRGYDSRLAPIEVHLMPLDPQTMNPISINRAFRGVIDKVDVVTPKVGGKARLEVKMASTSRRLTKTLTSKKSDNNHKRRSGDRFRKYADVSGSVTVWWGEAKALPPTKP